MELLSFVRPYRLVGEIGQLERMRLMAYVRGPEESSCRWPSESTEPWLTAGRWLG
jgi:hypothetical protein